MLYVFFVFILILKLLSYFWGNWTVPVFLQNLTLKNVAYMLMKWLFSNILVFCGGYLSLQRFWPDKLVICIIWIFIMVCSSLTNSAIQLVLTEILTLVSIPFILIASVAIVILVAITLVLKCVWFVICLVNPWIYIAIAVADAIRRFSIIFWNNWRLKLMELKNPFQRSQVS